MGVISEIITAFSRKRIFGYKFVALSSIGNRHHRLPGLGAPHVVSGMSLYAALIFQF